MMRVTFNNSFNEASQALADTAAELARRQQEVSSGRRLLAPSDDPASASASSTERAELAVTDRYQQAADSVESRLSVIDVVLSTLVDQTTEAKVAATSAQGSVQNESQREAAAERLLSIRDAILSAINTQYRGTYLFSGNDSTTAPWTRTGATISAYQGTATAVEIDIDRQTAVQVAFDGNAILKGSDAQDLFAMLGDLAEDARTGDQQGLADGVAALDRTFERLTRTQGRVGADLAELDSRRQQMSARRLAGQARVSKLEDANLAESISAMTRADTAYRAALGATSTIARVSLMDYLK